MDALAVIPSLSTGGKMFIQDKFWKIPENIKEKNKHKQTQKCNFSTWKEETASRKTPTKWITYKFCASN